MKPIFDHDNSVISERIIDTPSTIAKTSFFYIQESGYLKSLKPHISKRENMDSYLIIYVLSGEGYFTYNGKRTLVEEGACFFIDCMHPYSHESTSHCPWELLWVHFNGATSKQYFQYFQNAFNNIFYPTENAEIASLLRQLLTTNKDKPPFYEVLSSSLIVQLMTVFIVVPKRSRIHSQAATPMDDKLSQVHHFLSTNFNSPISLEHLAAQFFISKYYLCREFKKKYGKGINAYLTGKRITNAKELLRFSHKNISGIADQCGIADTNYFIKIFKAAEGLTPSEYRKKWKG